MRDEELVALRADIEKMFTDTCVVKRKTKVSNGAGGSMESWSDAASYPCRIAPAKSGDETTIGGAVKSVKPVVVILPYDADVTTADRLAISGATYEVTALVPRTTRISLQVEAVRIG